ncbi:MAG: SPFH domain-containing protein, partial [Clostridia bacterium]|nr:SPFH domain-containing protein [Clostridia bacterium]
MALFRLNIEWTDESSDTLVYKYPFKNSGREVNRKSSLTVRESQVAIFVHKGKIADVFEPGLYQLDTDILPILTKLAAWKYAFETPITLEVYFVNTKQFTNIKWGTQNPIMMRDPEFGVIRVRGYGAFAFKVDEPEAFLRELFGTNSTFKTSDIKDYAKTMLISALADAIGESKISALDLAGNTLEFNEIVKRSIQDKFNELGLKLTNLFIENMSVPTEVEKAIDERSRLGVLGGATDTMMKMAAADAIREAAKNPGMGGAFTSMGVGLGA